MILLKIVDIAFILFHTLLILFNCFGWIWKKTRIWNFITLMLTGASWFLLGIFYGFGYCPVTDWHFNILRNLGQHNLPNSYIKYLTDRLTGLDVKPDMVDAITLIVFFVVLLISIYINFLHSWLKKKTTPPRKQ